MRSIDYDPSYMLGTLINAASTMSCAMYCLHCLTLLNIAGVADVRGRLGEPVQPQSGAAAVSSSSAMQHFRSSEEHEHWNFGTATWGVPARVYPNILNHR